MLGCIQTDAFEIAKCYHMLRKARQPLTEIRSKLRTTTPYMKLGLQLQIPSDLFQAPFTLPQNMHLKSICIHPPTTPSRRAKEVMACLTWISQNSPKWPVLSHFCHLGSKM